MMAIIVSLHHLHAVDMSLGVPQNVVLLPERCPYKSCLLEFGKIYTLVPCELVVCHSAVWPYITWRSYEMIFAIGLPKRYVIFILSFFLCQSARSITGLFSSVLVQTKLMTLTCTHLLVLAYKI